MKQWSMPEIEKMSLQRTQGNPGHDGNDSYMSDDDERRFEEDCGPTGSGCPNCE